MHGRAPEMIFQFESAPSITRGAHLLPQFTTAKFLRRYATERRRRKIAPVYAAMLAEAERLVEPVVVQRTLARADVPGLSAWLPPHAVGVRLALCTLGPELDARSRALFEDEPAAAAVLDEIGVAFVSAFALNVHRVARAESAAFGLKAGPPHRPGLGRWPLDVQRLVFDKLPAAEIGVALGEHLVMTPVKSTSLIIPLLGRRVAGAV